MLLIFSLGFFALIYFCSFELFRIGLGGRCVDRQSAPILLRMIRMLSSKLVAFVQSEDLVRDELSLDGKVPRDDKVGFRLRHFRSSRFDQFFWCGDGPMDILRNSPPQFVVAGRQRSFQRVTTVCPGTALDVIVSALYSFPSGSVSPEIEGNKLGYFLIFFINAFTSTQSVQSKRHANICIVSKENGIFQISR